MQLHIEYIIIIHHCLYTSQIKCTTTPGARVRIRGTSEYVAKRLSP